MLLVKVEVPGCISAKVEVPGGWVSYCSTICKTLTYWVISLMHDFVFNGPKSCTFPELYEFESIRQVCATIVDFLGDIPEETRNRIVGRLYIDMCHLRPFSEKQENQLGVMGQLFAGMKKAVDKFHFRWQNSFPHHSYIYKFCVTGDTGVDTARKTVTASRFDESWLINSLYVLQTFVWMNRFT